MHHVCAIIVASHQVNSNIFVQGTCHNEQKQYRRLSTCSIRPNFYFRDLFGTGDDADDADDDDDEDDKTDREDEYDEDEASSSKSNS